MAFPMPSLSFSGGAGGNAETGDTRNTNPLAVSFGGFSVGGSGNRVAAGTATATATDAVPTWVWIAGLALAALALFAVVSRRRDRGGLKTQPR